jgi:hypothetical protein
LIAMSWKRFGLVSLGALAVFAVEGCYVYTAAPEAPAPGTHLDIGLTDRGRVELWDSVGPGASSIEGTSVMSTDSAYSLRVTKVSYLNGQSNSWTGEALFVPKRLITNATEQRFSRSRTWVAAAAVGGGLIAFIASRGLLGLGRGGDGGGTPPPKQN